ncbi:hypothetical protein [Microbispora bryophytorum]|uniref:MFS transporter n=1 Tax=Microbispora bryophytorum subsp. camponoti TaxID=1677852 RepID=A0ABR8L7U9_9ACTN|nr:hypothetical protein [Microbispora camponoti]MBD3146999.1 hypothetical protein [Microbispora camponoti]
MKAIVLSVLVVLVAPVLQVAVVNGLPLPGGHPDIVLVAVIALAPRLRPGPEAGGLPERAAADGTAGRRATVAAVVALGATLAGGVLAALLDGTPWGAALAPGAAAWTVGLTALVAAAFALRPRRRPFGRVPRSRGRSGGGSRGGPRDPYARGRRLA